MTTEIPNPIREAIFIAPTDPRYSGPNDNRVTNCARKIINKWEKADHDFVLIFEEMMNALPDHEKMALTLYLELLKQ